MTRIFLLRSILLLASIPPLVVSWKAPHRRFVVNAPVVAHATEPLYDSEYLPAVPTHFVHGATLAELNNGDLAAAWYAGSDEVKQDVVIYLSVRDHMTGRWSEPRAIQNRVQARDALKIPVKSLGNPVLYADRNGLHLFFVAVMAGGWSGGTICMMDSLDTVHWSGARHVVTSPFLDSGMLVRGAPAAYDDGTIALPIYYQLGAKWSALARVDAEGRVLDETRVSQEHRLIQPWILTTSPRDSIMLLRHSSRDPYCVTLVRSSDGGKNWSSVQTTPLVHRDSAVAGLVLSDGSLLVFYNNTAWDRRDLSVARTTDGGAHWSWPHPMERDTAAGLDIRHEYSYPFAIRTRDGLLHVVYTWQRRRIKHVIFNDTWAQKDSKLGVMR